MKYYELDEYEQEIEGTLEKGPLKPVPNMRKEIERIGTYFSHTLNRNKNINIRISERDLHKLKAKAFEEGLPYQTLVGSLLHKYVNS